MSGWQAAIRVTVGTLNLDVDLNGEAAPIALVGPNGSGKTTLLRVIAGALAPEAAEIRVGDSMLVSAQRGIDRPMEDRRIGYVPQGYRLFPHLSVLDNVAFGLSTGRRKRPRRERHQRAHALLAELGCGSLAGRRVTELSGGEQQRVALARALVVDPELLLLDEPLAALDATTRRTVRTFLADRLREFGRPSIIVTHDVRDVAALNARVYVLEGGQVVQSGTVVDLRARPATDFVAEFAAAVGPSVAVPDHATIDGQFLGANTDFGSDSFSGPT